MDSSLRAISTLTLRQEQTENGKIYIQLIPMKRDWELIREILTKLEETQSSKACLRSDELSVYDPDVVTYQMKLLIQAGLIEGLRGCKHCTAYSLTWEGHEFLDTVRSKPVWDSAVTILQEKGIEMSIDAFKTAARIAMGSIFGERQ